MWGVTLYRSPVVDRALYFPVVPPDVIDLVVRSAVRPSDSGPPLASRVPETLVVRALHRVARVTYLSIYLS